MGLLDELVGSWRAGFRVALRMLPAHAPGWGARPAWATSWRRCSPSIRPGRAAGFGGLLEQFQRAGFGDQVSSWVSTEPNRSIPPEAVEQFGRGGVAEIARRAGVSEQDASRGLSQLMPEVVDRVTPSGELPDAASLLASVESLANRLGAR
jgi:uncharacterized protein YidB (DUF937 family)